MSTSRDIQEGMQVYGGDQLLGRVESLHDDGFHMNGLHYTRDMVTRIEHNRIYLGDSGLPSAGAMTDTSMDAAAVGETAVARDVAATGTVGATRAEDLTDGTLRVPVAEERLAVGTREVDRGEVSIHKTVTEEQQTVPVTLTHEELRVEERDVADRPATGDDLFKEETIQVALRGQEAVVAKEAVVTGEVVIEKDAVSEERQVTDTVRKQHIDVDQTTRTVGAAASMRTTTARGTDTSATLAGTQVRESMTVVGADDAHIGVVKEVRASNFLVDRRMARDIYVPFTAIQSITNDRVMLTVNGGDVNNQGWPNP